MPDLYLGIAKRSEENARGIESQTLPDLDSYIKLCRDMYDYNEQNMDITAASTSIDFHTFGIAGAPGGEILAPMIHAASKIFAFFARITSAQTAFIMDSPASLIYLSESVGTVYTANTTLLGIANEVIATDSIDNVETLSWDTIRYEMPKVDFATAHITSLIDQNVLSGILGSVNPGGMFMLSNASNGSEYYHSENTFAEEVHNYIHSLDQFDSYHLQGYISYTCFIRR